jgi:hypothetical protein
MRKSLSIILAAGLLLYPFAAYTTDYGSQTSQTKQVPPVAQTLVREGDFAVKLAAKLQLGSPTEEASAEDMLAQAGVVPLNGWISDYPVTPEIVGQIQDSIAKAAAEGKLRMTGDEATNALFELTAELNLPTPTGPGSAVAEGSQAPAEQPVPPVNPTVVNNYYYDQGPPIITYYSPPVYYGYLYDWVPYPVWWFGFWFPGFYICHDFTTVVVVRTFIGPRTAIVSNRFIDPVTRTVVRVGPVVKTSKGAARPITTLRTGDGKTFATLADIRKGAGKPGTFANSASKTWGFRSPEARKGAQTIYDRSVQRMSTRTVRGDERRFIAPNTSGRPYRPSVMRGRDDYVRPSVPPGSPSRGGERWYRAPNAPERSFNGPMRGSERRFVAPNTIGRSYRPSVMRGRYESVRPFVSSGAPAQSFSAPAMRGGHYPMRTFLENGVHGR